MISKKQNFKNKWGLKSKYMLLYQKKSKSRPLNFSIFMGLILIVLIYTAIEETHILDNYGNFVWCQPLLLIIGLMSLVYKGLVFIQKINFKYGANDPILARSIMKSYLKRTYENIDKNLKDLKFTSADILNDMIKDKVLHIYNTDCLRFPEIRKQIDMFRLNKSNKLDFNIFFTTEKEYKARLLPREIRLISDTININRKELKNYITELKITHYNILSFLGKYLTIWHITQNEIDFIMQTYRYKPPKKDKAHRIAFALKMGSHINKFTNGKLNIKEQHDYEIMAEKIISNFATTIKKHKTAWKNVIEAYENTNKHTN